MRVFNFAAGPAMLPLEVLEQARDELTDWQAAGMSVMEISHRSKAFMAVAREAESGLRELLAMPPHYRVLFLQGGATGPVRRHAAESGAPPTAASTTSTPAPGRRRRLAEAQRYCSVNVAADAAASSYTTVPAPERCKLTSERRLPALHAERDHRRGGVSLRARSVDVPLVADMSSTILSRPIDVQPLRADLRRRAEEHRPGGAVRGHRARGPARSGARRARPAVWNYKAMADEGSMLNTPPTFAWYVAGLVFKWLQGQGGLPVDRASAIEAQGAAALPRDR